MAVNERILLVRFSAIGDLLLTGPVLRELANGQRHITLLVKRRCLSTAQLLRGVDAIALWEEDASEIMASAKDRFDRIIDLQGTGQSKRWVRQLGLPTRTFQKPYLRRVLLLLTKSRRFTLAPVVHRYAEAAGVEVNRSPLSFNLSAAPRARNSLVFVIGGSHAGKRLSGAQWSALIGQFSEENIALLGGPEDRALANELVQKHPRILDVTDTSVEEGLAIIADACAVVSGDTGFMHAAALMGKPLVSLWGATHPALGFAPWPEAENQRIVLTKGASPISKHGKVPFYRGNPMRNLDLEEVAKAIAAILSDRTTP